VAEQDLYFALFLRTLSFAFLARERFDTISSTHDGTAVVSVLFAHKFDETGAARRYESLFAARQMLHRSLLSDGYSWQSSGAARPGGSS
jgi:hypothetical protein